MATLSGQLARQTFGAIDNSHLTTDHDGFAWVQMPYESEAQPWAGGAALTTHWPVEANGRALTGQRGRAHVDDWYYRVHLSPRQLDLGNVVSTQTTPVSVWSAWLAPRTLTALDGLDEGIIVSGQPTPPTLFLPLQERVYDVAVTPDGSPVLDTVLSWAFDNGEAPGLRITANRIVAWGFVPDWGDGVIERMAWATDILQSESLVEQRRALRLAPRREFEAPVYAEGRERQYLDLALFGWGSRVWAMPVWPDIQILASAVASGALSIACETDNLEFHAGGLALLRGESVWAVEVVEVESVSPGLLTLKRATQMAWPAGTRLYPAVSAELRTAPSLTRKTDRLAAFGVTFRVLDAVDVEPLAPATLYRGRPVLEARPDESEDLSSQYARLLAELDSGMSAPLVTDIAGRAMPMMSHRWIGMGRAERYAYRRCLHYLRGRQRAMWVPTHADDLTLAAAMVSTSLTMDVPYVGYTRFGQGRAGRRDIRIELNDGTVLHRRITGSTELSVDLERLSIDTAPGRAIDPADVARICWMTLCRLDSDAVEIEHITDSEGVARSALVFRGVRDDEF